MRRLPAQQFNVADDVFPRLKLVAAKLQTGGKLRMRVLPLNEVVAVEQVAFHLLLILQTCVLGKCTGISIIDSTPLVSCHIKRMHIHETVNGWAAKDKCTMGWFYGFKLHLVINDKTEIIQCQLMPGNVDDRTPLKESRFYGETLRKTLCRQGDTSARASLTCYLLTTYILPRRLRGT